MKLFTIAAALLISSIHSSEAAVPKLRANLKNGASTADAEVEMIESKSAATTEVDYEMFGPGHCQDADGKSYDSFVFYNLGDEMITVSECKGKCECALGVTDVEFRGYFFRTFVIGTDLRSSECACFVENVAKMSANEFLAKCGYDFIWKYGGGGSGEITNSDGGDGTCYRKKL